ncbi:HPP family protein [Paenibacillus sp. CC-CFT747]|nr:HPP family protein [Paenibacillus sp. CC-CFT747]
MNSKTLVICLYLLLIYWLSVHYGTLHWFFYPSLGAFSFLLMHRTFHLRELGKVVAGAVLVSTISSVTYHLSSGLLCFLGTSLLTVWLMTRLKWNAPPILALSLVPFFAHPDKVWSFPVAVAVTLLGLMLAIAAALWLEAWSVSLVRLFAGKAWFTPSEEGPAAPRLKQDGL